MNTHISTWLCAAFAAAALGCQKAPPPAKAAAADASAQAAAPSRPGARVIAMKVTPDGYEPARLTVKKGEPLELKITRTTNDTCATELIIEGTSINAPLPYNEEVTVHWTPEKTGSLKYGCHMDFMVSGVLTVE